MAPVRRTARNLTIHMVFFIFFIRTLVSSFPADGEAVMAGLLKANERPQRVRVQSQGNFFTCSYVGTRVQRMHFFFHDPMAGYVGAAAAHFIVVWTQ
jgi:hypothetical protein